MESKIKIHSNGSKWAGEENDTIDQLIEVLKVNRLDFQMFGCHGFVHFREDNGFSSQDYRRHNVQISGNFLDISHVFNIEGVYQDLENVITAIEENLKRQSDEYNTKLYPIK